MARLACRLFVVPGLLIALLGALVGCGDDRPERAVTVEPSSSQATNSGGLAGEKPEEPEEVEAPPQSSAGDLLTKKQDEAALLTVNDLPSGWAKSPEEDDDDSEDKIEPTRCQDVLDALDSESTDAAVETEVNFSKGGAFGTLMSETISSYSDEVDEGVVQKIADAFSECPNFTSTDADGEVSKVTVSPMSFANLGDQTLAVAMTYESSMFTVSFNLAYIVTGHNVLALINGGIAGADGAELEKLAKIAVAKLEDAAA